MAVRHQQLWRGGSLARRSRLPGRRAVPSRGRHDALSRRRCGAQWPAGGVSRDAIALMDALDIDEAIVAGFDWGARTANVVAALWPERCRAMVSVSGYLIGGQAANIAPLPPA